MKQVGSIVERMKQGEIGPARHDNPYLAETLELAGIIHTGTELKSSFPQIFPDPTRPCVLEIGCYMGKTVLDFAQANPQINILGLDITYKRVAKAGRKIKLDGLVNARIGICDGQGFLNAIPAHSLQGVMVFFPDPWPKKKQRKNRLLNREFFESLKSKLAPGGFFWFKTDHAEYFESAMNCALQSAWKVSPHESCPAAIAQQAYITVFERLFLEKSLPTYHAVCYL